jgi:hypothetical protein
MAGLRVPETIVNAHPFSYHQSAIGAGPEFLAEHPRRYLQRALNEGPRFNGYIIADALAGCLTIDHDTRCLYLVAEFPGASIVDYDCYWDGEAILARLQLVAK